MLRGGGQDGQRGSQEAVNGSSFSSDLLGCAGSQDIPLLQEWNTPSKGGSGQVSNLSNGVERSWILSLRVVR